MRLAVLEKRAICQILGYLLTVSEGTRTDLRDNVDASLRSIYSSIPILKKEGLVIEDVKEEFPFKVTLKLSDKGKRIANHLNEIDKILVEN